VIGKALFGWIDKGRNRMNLPDDRLYDDHYSAYPDTNLCWTYAQAVQRQQF